MNQKLQALHSNMCCAFLLYRKVLLKENIEGKMCIWYHYSIYMFVKEIDNMKGKDKFALSRDELNSVLQSGQFQVYLQPQIDMVTLKLHGAEALSRWRHPTEGLLLPLAFIPQLEESGVIDVLDMYIFEEVCRIKADWKGRHEKYADTRISVNMSRNHLYNEDFPRKLSELADRYGIRHEELEIEITETVFVEDTDTLIKSIEAIKAQGFYIAIDDFGSGFSGLNLLKDISVDTIKIDKSFLHGSGATERGKSIIRNVIALCLDLKVDVITEGIEMNAQAEFIKKCGCKIAQGFFYSKPLPIAEFEKLADTYIGKALSSYAFHLDGNLLSEAGNFEGMAVGHGFGYREGVLPNTKSLYFPGGPTAVNVVFIPKEALINDSYTISMWVKPEKLTIWSSAFYIRYEIGFVSIAPCSDTGKLTFRLWNSKGMNGWYDIEDEKLKENEWTHLALSYNARTDIETAFVNGEPIGTLENVPTNRYVEEIIIGGDNFKESFKGCINEVVIYNEAKDEAFIKQFYQLYVDVINNRA